MRRYALVLLAAASATCRAPAAKAPGRQPSPEPGRALTASEVQSVLQRMKPIARDDQDEKDFALRERSLPPPRPGATVSESFPPPARPAPPPVEARPLEV